jgi:hypothetical protein
MKISLAFFLSLLLVLVIGSFADAEMAKEGSGEGGTYFTTTYQVLVQGKEYLQMNYDARGVSSTENPASPMYMASGHCIGSLRAAKGIFTNDSDLCKRCLSGLDSLRITR